MNQTDPKTAVARLVEALKPLVALLKGLPLTDPAAVRRTLEQQAPLSGPLVAAIRPLAEAGMREGWLCPKENMGIRFGRPVKDLDGFSVDAVVMATPGPRHRHPGGEIDLCFATKGSPRFDGQPEGWVVYGPGSVHVPTVAGGEMLILYFLPGGAIEFLKENA